MRFYRIVGLMLSQPRLAARDPLVRIMAAAVVLIILLFWSLA
jgi:hypothetical protein